MDILLAPFMLRALLAAAVTGLAAPAVGTYLVQRRLSLMGDGIGHVAVTGVALGLLTGTSPTLTAVIVSVLGALLIELIRSTGRATGDVALALLFYGGIAGGLLLVSLAGNGVFALQQYLFGSITTISTSAVTVSVVLAAVVLIVSFALLPQLFSVANDEDYARTTGLQVRFYNVVISVLAAVTVSVAMRTVGLLLISALMIIPVATAQQFSRGFRVTMLGAMLAGTLAALTGVTLSRAGRRAPRRDDRAGLAGRVRADLPHRAGGAAPSPGRRAVPGRRTRARPRRGRRAARPRPRTRVRAPGGRARRPRRLHPRRPPARRPRRPL